MPVQLRGQRATQRSRRISGGGATTRHCFRADCETSIRTGIMAPFEFDSHANSAEQPAATYRAAPHNIEAEQALLGAILVNNEAFYRVSDFLEPQHFFEPLHQQIYELAAQPDPRRQDRDAGHAQDLPARRPRHRRADAQPVPRAPRRRGDHRHQRRGLRPHHLRPRDPPRADPDRRGHGQRRLRRAGRFRAARADRGRRAPALRARRDRPLRRRLPALRDRR